MTRASERKHPVCTAKLEGTQIVEASAGTGKTWTIAGLYVRLLLEKGAEVRQILAITFTIAAAAELRDRIRRRIQDVLEALEGRAGEDDEFVRWAVDWAKRNDPDQAKKRLTLAVNSFDEARIYTIHGFCQRALAEHAFGSAISFSCELLPDTSEILHEVAADFWRARIGTCVAAGSNDDDRLMYAHWMSSKGAKIQTLESLALRFARRQDLDIRWPKKPAAIGSVLPELRKAHQKCRDLWHKDGPRVRKLLKEAPGLDRRSYRPSSVDSWCDAVGAHFESAEGPFELPAKLERLGANMIAGASNGKPPSHQLFIAVDELLEASANANDALRASWVQTRLEFIEFARKELPARLAKRNLQSFDDLLLNLHMALEAKGGEQLAEALARNCPYALVDEFQDTDPLQWQIVRRIYDKAEKHAVFLVGDPKQAIYSFRGADVYAYLSAASSHKEKLELLENNRSVPGLITAINGVFSQRADPFRNGSIAHNRAIPAKREKASLIEDKIPDEAPLRIAVAAGQSNGKPLNKDDGRSWAVDLVRGEIVRLLGAAQAGRITWGARELRAGDIAVLVNTNQQAASVRTALAEAGISCAELSTLSVFKSEEAEQLQRLLLAMSKPKDAGCVKAALVADLIGLDAEQLLELEKDDAWEKVLGEFADYHAIWVQSGVMRALREVFRRRGTYEKLALFRNGERRLTNLFHLCELLALEEQRIHGIDSLVSWMALRRQSPPTEDMQLRLDSDANLVQIVTIHRSKGLEYPVTFVPFLWDASSYVDEDMVVYHGPGPDYPLMLNAKDPDAHLVDARGEELEERLRVAYVALTRAKNRCYLFTGSLSGNESSALGWLLHGADGASVAPALAGDPAQHVAQLCAKSDGTTRLFKPNPEAVERKAAKVKSKKLVALKPSRTVREGYATTSFSRLKSEAIHVVEEESARDHDETVPVPARSPAEPDGRRATFPGGTRAGNCLHNILERVDFGSKEWQAVIRTELQGYSYPVAWAADVEQWLREVVATPLPVGGGSIRLSDLEQSVQFKELEFHLSASEFTPMRVVAAMRKEGLPVSNLSPGTLHGYLTGAIDLVFRHGGRWYIADYKSNRIDADGGSYGGKAVAEAMEDGDYHLQYLIYAIAVHRWLRSSLKNYEYERDYGGVAYLFLRGMHPDRQNDGVQAGVYTYRPTKQLVETLDRCLGVPAELAA